MIKVELCSYNGWEDCVKISNDQIEVIAATKIGPRILRLAFLSENNIFYEAAEQKGLTGGEDWRIYGGHRLWHGPQIGFRPNEADNQPIFYELLEDGVILTGNKEEKSNMQKQITVRISKNEPEVYVTHCITNHSAWPVELTAWALSVMAGGGIALWPRSAADTKFLPNHALIAWPYTDLEDPRFHISKNYMSLKQDSSVKNWFKAGTNNVEGIAAYLLGKTLFIKKYEHIVDAVYSDLGSSFEIYTDADIIELESLSPLTKLELEEAVTHNETWRLMHFEENDSNISREELEMKIYSAVKF